MAEYTNPPLLNAAPSVGMVPVFDANGELTPTVLGTLPAAVIPQPHEAATSAPSAVTAVAVVTTPSALVSYGYTEAQADAIVAQGNALVVDVTALRTELNTLTTAHNALVSALQTAGILASS